MKSSIIHIIEKAKGGISAVVVMLARLSCMTLCGINVDTTASRY